MAPLDLALMHPTEPGRFVLGIECDGPTYHRAATARDRDRLRPQVLAQLGWRLCRVWAPEWVMDRERELRRIDEAFQMALVQPVRPVEEAGCSSTVAEDEEEEIIDVEWEPVIEEPKLLPAAEPLPVSSPRYSNIDDVPYELITDTLVALARSSGRTDQESLIRAVSYAIGFRRTGKRIQERLKWAIRDLVRKRILVRDENRWLYTADESEIVEV